MQNRLFLIVIGINLFDDKIPIQKIFPWKSCEKAESTLTFSECNPTFWKTGRPTFSYMQIDFFQ